MRHHKHKNKKAKEPKLTHEEMIYEAASDLASSVGISFSEALGFTLGIDNPTYGWEYSLSEEEFQDLLNNHYRDQYMEEVNQDDCIM